MRSTNAFILLVAFAIIASAYSQWSACTPFKWSDRSGSCSSWATYNPDPTIVQSLCNKQPPNGLLTDLGKIFPEGKTPNSALIGPSIYITITQDNTNVSITFLHTGAGNTNQLGYFRYNSVPLVASDYKLVFPRINTNSGGCQKVGDTSLVGPFMAGDLVGFYIVSDGFGKTGQPVYVSFLDPPTLTNPDATCAPNGCPHTAWVSMSDYDNTNVFGFEDLSLGDADYNDVQFTFEVFGGGTAVDIPDYGGGKINKCNKLPSVSSASYVEIDCVQWALLESSQAQACMSYFSLPTGWTWAPDDATSKAVIVKMANQWAYTEASCFILSTGPTTGNAYHSDGTPCAASEWTFSTMSVSNPPPNPPTVCYSSACTSRFVLKGQDLGTACTGLGGSCSPSTNGAIIAQNPSVGFSAPVLPFAYSVFLKASNPTGTVPLKTTVAIPPVGSVLLDILILIDTNGLSSSDKSYIINSAKDLHQTFSDQGFLANSDTSYGVAIGFALYNPTSNTDYYISYPSSLVYTPSALISQLSAWNPPGPTTQTSTKIPAAVGQIMSGSSVNWRSDAYHSIWVISKNDWVSSSTLGSISKSTGIVPIFEYPQKITKLPTSWTNAITAANLPLVYSFIGSGSSSNPLQNVFASSTGKGATYFASTVVSQVLAVPGGGDTQFLGPMPPVISSSFGSSVDVPYSVSWPSSTTSTTVTGYSTSVLIMGRRSTSISISFNHPPTITNYAQTVDGNSVSNTLTFSPYDQDSNTLTWILASPSIGQLYRPDNTMINMSSPANTPGSMVINYVPKPYFSGVDTFTFTISDGCATATATAAITVNFVNAPPVATNIAISVYEDSLWNSVGPTGDPSGRIDFSSHMTDYDNSLGGKSQTLKPSFKTSPVPSTYGALYSYSTTSAGSPLSTGIQSSNLSRYEVVKNAGYGTVTFTYQAYDGFSYSADATVTITIIHVNHPPVLTVSVHSISALSGTTDIAISASIYDQDGDNVNLYLSAHNLTQQTVSAQNTAVAGTPTNYAGFHFYTTNQSVDPSTHIFDCAGLKWDQAALNPLPESISLIAIDAAGGISSVESILLIVTSISPPQWVTRPQTTATEVFTMQASTSANPTSQDNMKFSATDVDSYQWQYLTYTIASMPTNGVITLKSNGEDGGHPDLALSASSAWVRKGDYNTVPASLPDGYISVDNTSSTTFFNLKYTPNLNYVGNDQFSLIVTDPTGLQAPALATVRFNMLRNPTPPVTSDIRVDTNEETTRTFSIPLSSTNGDTVEVSLVMETLNFAGAVYMSNGTLWSPGVITTFTSAGSLNFYLVPATGTYSDPDSVPVGIFTYHAYETASLQSITHTASIYVHHVNHPPYSNDLTDTVKKGTVLSVTIPARDQDKNDPSSSLTVTIVSLPGSNKGTFYLDSNCTLPFTSDSIGSTGIVLPNHMFWYLSEVDFSVPENTPLAQYKFTVTDTAQATSPTYNGLIFVTPRGDPPIYGGSLNSSTYQETPLPMSLGTDVTTETGTTNFTIRIMSMPQYGTFSVCDDNGICTQITAAPHDVPSTAGRVVFTPRDYDWGYDFTSFDFAIIDGTSLAFKTWKMWITVFHVNKRPEISASNFVTTSQSSYGVSLNESSSIVLNWAASDVDSLPSTLTTHLRVTFYTSQGFSLYSCALSGDYNTTDCTYDASVPFAQRADFKANAIKSMVPYDTVTTDCTTFAALKARLGSPTPNCVSHFKLAFVPIVDASYTPYISITFTSVDDYEAVSNPITVLLIVNAINNPPTIWSPPLVIAGSGIVNPFIRDTSLSSATYNQAVVVADIDSNNGNEELTIAVTSGTGELVWPPGANCIPDPAIAKQWVCTERIPVFNSWLMDLRFNVTSSNNQAELTFTINDLGNSGSIVPSPHLSASSKTVIKISPAVVTPPAKSNTLAIAVGVAAGAGLLLLGALGFFLRNKVAPPTDDYFAAATTPLSAAPQSPLYSPQNTENFSPLYKGT